eukprot:1073833-Karenia_brevis.AAC.1
MLLSKQRKLALRISFLKGWRTQYELLSLLSMHRQYSLMRCRSRENLLEGFQCPTAGEHIVDLCHSQPGITSTL